MKKNYVRFLFLIFIMLIAIYSGCNKVESPVKVKGSESATVRAEGWDYNNGLLFEFNGENKGFTLETPNTKAIHDSTTCDECGYTEYNGKKAYHICAHKRGQNGFRLKFETPLKADSFDGATIEFMTSDKATKSELKLLAYNEDSSENVLNDETFLSSGSDDWKNLNIGIDDFSVLANKDGYVEGFHFYIKNTNKVDFYITGITFKINAEELCNAEVDSLAFYEKGAVESIANQIKTNFEEANLAADIMVKCESYLQNTSKDSGEIVYNAEVTMSNGKFFTFSSIEKIIPSIKNGWLEINDSLYGATQELGNWEKNFKNCGVLSVEDHEISCAEGLKKMQYAVIPADNDYTDPSIEWHDAQKLILNKKGIKSMYINSFLDYGNNLVNGQSYKMIVRGLTNNDNYIKHIDKTFTYNEYDSNKNASVINAFNNIKNINISADSNDISEDFVKNKISEVIKDNNVSIVVKKKNVAASTTTFDIGITYSDKEASGCFGDAFTLHDFIIWHNEQDLNKELKLTAPFDGTKNIIIASQYIYDMADTSYEEYTNVSYGYIYGEECTPTAIKLEWEYDGQVDEYKIFVSESIDFSNAYEFTTKDQYFDLYNLKVGTKYYWKVSAGDVTSAVFCFETKGGYPRFIKADGVSNMRDIGGYITKDNKIIKQGLIYRSASLDDIKQAAKNDIAYMLGIKTDLDLRGGTGKLSPLGKDVQYIPEALQWYHGIFNAEDEIITAETVKLFADESNYPIDFHCSLGRDRTGTLSMILLGLLGVEEETIFREYHFSFFSNTGMFTVNEFTALQVNLSEFKRHLADYGGENATFNERIEAYMLAIGVTQDEINSIRNIMLADAPVVEEDIESNVVYEDDDSSLFTIILIASLVAIVVAIAIAAFVIIKKRRNNRVGDNN